jgi:hypothetical protein
VTEHRIRLRGGWGCRALGLAASADEPVTLPIRWNPPFSGPIRLTRRFGRPPFDPQRQALILRLDQVAGTRSILLNGQLIAGVSPERSLYELSIDHPRDRNLLVLEVQPPVPATEAAGDPAEWGVVALVLRPAEAGGGSPATLP